MPWQKSGNFSANLWHRRAVEHPAVARRNLPYALYRQGIWKSLWFLDEGGDTLFTQGEINEDELRSISEYEKRGLFSEGIQ